MTVTSVDKDYEALTLTLVADFTAPVDEVWQLWADPRRLERWWGPPTHPATFERHELAPGGTVSYHMTGPDGAKYPGWWRISAVEAPTRLEFTDGFADQDGNPTDTLPTSDTRMRLTATAGGTRMELHSTFRSKADMDTIIEMGTVEGLTLAVGQMDALLVGTAAG